MALYLSLKMYEAYRHSNSKQMPGVNLDFLISNAVDDYFCRYTNVFLKINPKAERSRLTENELVIKL